MFCDLEYKLAHLILHYSVNLKENEIIEIRGPMSSAPLLKQLYIEALKIGAYPNINLHLDEHSYLFMNYANRDQLQFIHKTALVSMETTNAIVSIDSPMNSRDLTNIDPKKIAKRSEAARILKDIMFEREKKGELRWNLSPYPTYSMAQDAEMSFEEFSQFVYKACKLHEDNPVLAWENIAKKQQQIIDKIKEKKFLHYKGKNTDLKISVENRRWVNCKGTHNLPDGEIFTSPIEESAEGHIYFDIPTSFMGNEVKGLYLAFEKGRIVEARAEKGEKILQEIIKTDEGASKVGEIAFGLNDSINIATKNILFDEKIGQTMHLALGSSYPEAGGLNKSAIHWDLIKDMRESEVYFDNELLYKNGDFIV
jgi:aminopeptidase